MTTGNRRRKKLMSEPNSHTTKHFLEKLLAVKMNKINVKKNKPVCLGMLILDISKMAIDKYWYDYKKQKYGTNAKLFNAT